MSPYQYNTSNELTSTPNATYTYDTNGNTLSDPSGKQYSWDFENRLTSITVPGTGTTTFRYDPWGRRIQKSGPLGTTNFLYYGWNATEELDNSGNILARYTQGEEDEPLAVLRGTTTSYYEQDGIWSVSSLTDPAGALANTYTYDAFGSLTASSGTLANPFRFTGREFDAETGIYFYRARYYDQNIGRFSSEDPIGFNGGDNFYRYALNNPIRFRDPSGKSPGVGVGLAPIFAGGISGAEVGGSMAGPIGGLVGLNVGLLINDISGGYDLGVAYGWWGQPKPQQECAKKKGCTCMAKCTCHVNGTPNHANTGTYVFGYGSASTCAVAQIMAKRDAGLSCPPDSHAQHCGYRCNQ
jgi:RHS repeat-associated protein